MTALYDGYDPVQEQSPTGTVSANLQIGLGVDERFTRTKAGATSTYLTDLLGSTVALADSAGVVQTSYGYDPYGVSSQTGAANDNPYQFTGRQNDGTGLYYYRARYYNPSWGRFINEDPIGLAGGVSLYAYAGGSPIGLSDPLGLQASTPIPDPNGEVPGGPWTPAQGQRPGDFWGPKQGSGGRTMCRWVPPEGPGSVPGSKGYFKTRAPGQDWTRWNPETKAPFGSAEEAHPNPLPSNPLPPFVRYGTPLGAFLATMFHSSPAY
ncbi:RHS repeat-associated core domain-containing protein [Dongia sedimenti]|uniref:RHS repeat-associated core domain-containing protein n=1 Tax=Dongia sedimenti TaxID=3064282 RepID=A0ABU0YHU4_9PROT|nr:RHS repeat-associated core domain-containing protein [Rhodospirillaceae bacterium R-7]